jgi:hypothetical protein
VKSGNEAVCILATWHNNTVYCAHMNLFESNTPTYGLWFIDATHAYFLSFFHRLKKFDMAPSDAPFQIEITLLGRVALTSC